MVNVQISYNPYTVKTDIAINGKTIEDRVSPLTYIVNKRLQEWIEPRGSWQGFFKTLRTSSGENAAKIEFTGTFGDFEDLVYAKDKFGDCFNEITLIHKNKDSAKDADPYQKMIKLKELYHELQEGPVEEFKSEDIKKNFENAINSDFRIVIIAPMSSGKSTLINAVIGRDLLPALSKATTAVITEIRDNDSLDDFIVNADDKFGNNVCRDKKATRETVTELNEMKDPNDPKHEEALIHLIQVEGPIPNIPSDTLNTVFVDTPGGNYSQNSEHGKIMDNAINDENKSMILYVFNGTQLGTEDSDIILKKIAGAMQYGTNGKRSRDRFLFVANIMDAMDVDKESYEEVIENTILPQLASKGITEPHLFLTSAQTAKLIHMTENGEAMTKKEQRDCESLVDQFNDETMILPKYASLNSAEKDKLVADALEYMQKAKQSTKEADRNKYRYRAAEIGSGIPAVEIAIREYLQKYAVAIKIKTVHDTFMKKVMERNMVDNCEAEWAASKENFEAVKKELQEKRECVAHNKKLQEFRDKVNSIRLDEDSIRAVQEKMIYEIDKLVGTVKEKVKPSEAENIMQDFVEKLEKSVEDAKAAVIKASNDGVIKYCQSIVAEYADYINELAEDGVFSVGNFDIRMTEDFAEFTLDTDKVENMLGDTKYVRWDYVFVRTRKVPKKGIIAFFKKLFKLDSGYEMVDDYEYQEFIKLNDIIHNYVADEKLAFNQGLNTAIKDVNGQVEKVKSETNTKLEGLDKMVSDVLAQIDEKLVSQEKLKAKVEANEEKSRWIKNFINQVEDLLTV